MAKRDYYEILGVPRGVDGEALKKAYRALAMRDHPDRNPGDSAAEERFKEASEAYSVLSDPEKRRAYDRFGHAGVGAGAPGGGFQDFGDLGGFTDLFDDLFGDLFGGGRRGGPGGRRRGRGQRGADLRYNLELELGDILEGLERKLKIPKMRPCETCSGSGARDGAVETCGTCKGSGQLVLQQGFFRVSRPCDNCQGAGEVVLERCSDCRGQGRVEGQQTISVRIPPGVDDGTRLRLAGEGEAGIAGGPNGDLYVAIRVKPHEFFERDGPDLHCQVPVTMVQAALGGEVEVPTLEGKVKIRIERGTQSGKQMRLRGKGLPTLRSATRGDQLLHLFVETPTELSDKQRELLEAFAEESGTQVSPAHKGFLDRLRELFD